MKLLAFAVLLFCLNCVAYAQSACIARCEAEIGLGDSRCPEICKGVPDKRKARKKADGSASAASASAPSSTSASTPKKEPAELKDAKAAFESGQAAGK
ncbi:MAG: hypothetical protein RL748_4302 [Pseudomonadota bacterium]